MEPIKSVNNIVVFTLVCYYGSYNFTLIQPRLN